MMILSCIAWVVLAVIIFDQVILPDMKKNNHDVTPVNVAAYAGGWLLVFLPLLSFCGFLYLLALPFI